jgi:transposase
MKITTVGVDLAKDVFMVHGVDSRGHVVLRKRLSRTQMAHFFAKLPQCLVGMESCASGHHWARKLQGFGHTVKLMAPQFVKPYVKGNKNDAQDAEAICEAVGRPNMRFVAIKNEEQQAVLALHRARQGFVKARTAQGNQIRGLLGEYGITIPKGIRHIPKRVGLIIRDESNGLVEPFLHLLVRLLEHFKDLDKQVRELELEIGHWHRNNFLSRKLAEVPGIGPITASALVATIGNGKDFSNGRQLSAYLGLVPRQHSSGGKQVLLGISKRGDSTLRTLLIHGARAVVRAVQARAHLNKSKPQDSWLNRLLVRSNTNVATVALANKNARILWALLSHDRRFDPDWGTVHTVVME